MQRHSLPIRKARALDCGNLELFTALDRKGLDEIMEDLARIGITNILNNLIDRDRSGSLPRFAWILCRPASFGKKFLNLSDAFRIKKAY